MKHKLIYRLLYTAVILALILAIFILYFKESAKSLNTLSFNEYITSALDSAESTINNNLTNNERSVSMLTRLSSKFENRYRNSNGTINLEKVETIGYTYYVGRLDKSGETLISDEIKNDFSDIFYRSKLPTNLVSDVAIVIVNPLAISEYQNIITPRGEVSIPEFPPVFLSGGGLYSKSYKQMSIIFINTNKLDEISLKSSDDGGKLRYQLEKESRSYFLSNTLIHELGHHLGKDLSSEEWENFYKLRDIPENTPLYNENWRLSPSEDFAEVYKNTVTGLPVRTYYGTLEPSGFVSDDCSLLQTRLLIDNNYKESVEKDKRLQKCRRDVLKSANPNKELPYVSTVDRETEQFIFNVIDKRK